MKSLLVATFIAFLTVSSAASQELPKNAPPAPPMPAVGTPVQGRDPAATHLMETYSITEREARERLII